MTLGWDIKNDFDFVLQFFSLFSSSLDGVPREICTKQFSSRKLKVNCCRKHLLHFIRDYALGSFYKCCQENLNFESFLLLNDLQVSEKKTSSNLFSCLKTAEKNCHILFWVDFGIHFCWNCLQLKSWKSPLFHRGIQTAKKWD